MEKEDFRRSDIVEHAYSSVRIYLTQRPQRSQRDQIFWLKKNLCVLCGLERLVGASCPGVAWKAKTEAWKAKTKAGVRLRLSLSHTETTEITKRSNLLIKENSLCALRPWAQRAWDYLSTSHRVHRVHKVYFNSLCSLRAVTECEWDIFTLGGAAAGNTGCKSTRCCKPDQPVVTLAVICDLWLSMQLPAHEHTGTDQEQTADNHRGRLGNDCFGAAVSDFSISILIATNILKSGKRAEIFKIFDKDWVRQTIIKV